MNAFLPIILVALFAARLAQAATEVPYSALAAPMKLTKTAVVDGRTSSQFYLRLKDPGSADLSKAEFRIRTAQGDVNSLRVAALAKPLALNGAEFTHEIWIPSPTEALKGATLLHDLPRGSVVLEVGMQAKPTTGKVDAEGQKQMRRAAEELVVAEQVFGAEHLEALRWERKLAELLGTVGAFETAEPLARHAAAGFAKHLGADHHDARDAELLVSITLRGLERHAEAEKIMRRQLAIAERVDGPEAKQSTVARLGLMESLMQQKRFEEVETLAQRVIAAASSDDPTVQMCVVTAHSALAKLSDEKKQFPQAVAHSRAAALAAEKFLGKTDESTVRAKLSLGVALLKAGEKVNAGTMAREVMAGRDKGESVQDPLWLEAKALLAEAMK